MNAKEKANELMSKFVGISLSQVNELVDGVRIRLAKESAFILVDEIIDQIYKSGEMSAKAQIEWWKRVKSELQSF
jgi:hypothetical protein